MNKSFPPGLESLAGGLVVSCQAPSDSPLHNPMVIAAMAQAAVIQGAVGVRIDSPAHVAAVRNLVSVPIIGLWKQVSPDYPVYITPRFDQAEAVALAGADIIAIDATQRPRPEDLGYLITQIQDVLGKPVMADIDTEEAAQIAADLGVDCVGTTLFGYTELTGQEKPPAWDLLTKLVKTMTIPVICEGGISSPTMARQALDLGANCVVVGTDITGIDLKVQAYLRAMCLT
nr:N-acetylmannosamine-6-phosphate 2-epimerase [Synechococcus sp. PCC 6312]